MHATDSLAIGEGLRASLRGPPQPERLLMSLLNTIAIASSSPAPESAADTHLSNNANNSSSSSSSGLARKRTRADSVEGNGSRAASALISEVCGLFASDALPLFVALRGRERDAQALLSRLSRERCWRRALLFPQLRRWRDDGLCHPFPGAVLLPSLLSAVESELRAAWPAESADSGGAREANGRAYAEAEEELHAIAQATGSFRALCVGMDVTLRNHTRRLVRRVRAEPWRKESEMTWRKESEMPRRKESEMTWRKESEMTWRKESEMTWRKESEMTWRKESEMPRRKESEMPRRKESEMPRQCAAAAAAWAERAVRRTARAVWADVFALFSRCGADGGARESLYLFAAALLASQAAALQRTEEEEEEEAREPKVANDIKENVKKEENEEKEEEREREKEKEREREKEKEKRRRERAAVRRLIERLRDEARGALAARLSALPNGPPPPDAFDAAARHALLWSASARAEFAVSRCSARPAAVREWARQTASRAWGSAVCAARALERAETESGTRAAAALETRAERISAACERRAAGRKHRRVEGPYAAEFFLRVHDAGGFALLALERQDALSAALRNLHGVVVNAERAAVVASLNDIVDTREDRDALLRWYDREVHAAICGALRKEAPLLMCLLHAVFTLAEREGTSSLRTHETLHGVLLTTLAHLCCDDGGGEGAQEDDADADAVEDYFERRQALAALIASGLLALPWDPRGLRLRLLLHNAVCDAVSDAFSAEDALAAVEDIARHARLNECYNVCSSETESALEAAAVTICSGTRHEPALRFLLQLSAGGDVPSDDILRAEAPTYFPAPCGALIVLAAHRALSRRLHALRAEWDEEQCRRDATDAAEYLGRRAMFGTSRDVAVFRVLVQLAHRMAFAAQLQPRGLLRLWISYLRDLFTRVVPPPEDDDMTRADPRGTWRALRRSPVESPQAEMRAALGEMFADLALAPLVDHFAARQWLRGRRRRANDVAALQRILPVAVLEEICAAIGLRVGNGEEGNEREKERGRERRAQGENEEEEEEEEEDDDDDDDDDGYGDEEGEGGGEGRGKRVEQSFLGVTGAVAFCQRLEAFIVPDTITDKRTVALLNTLWGAINQSIAGGM